MKLNRTREEWEQAGPYAWAGMWEAKEALEDLATLFAEVERLRGALEEVTKELGVPGEGYPQPVTNAYFAARQALGDTHD